MLKSFFFLVFSGVALISASLQVHGEEFRDVPALETPNEPWRIMLYQGGGYKDYNSELVATMKGLEALGWVSLPGFHAVDKSDARIVWQWLSENAVSKYLSFHKSDFYSAEWDKQRRSKIKKELLLRLGKGNGKRLVLAMGTWAGTDLANEEHSTPTLVISSSDPITAGIIRDVNDSGIAHVNATVDPFLHERQLRVFHELVNFKSLGVAFEDSPAGRSYAAIDAVEKLKDELNFETVYCHTKSDVVDVKDAEASVLDCVDYLVGSSNAIYITLQGGVNESTLPKIVNMAVDSKVPTFSQSGSDEVKQGVLFSLSRSDFKHVGYFHASIIGKILNGASPRLLPQLFEEPPEIAINLKTAELVGFNPPLILLGAADEIYREIYQPE